MACLWGERSLQLTHKDILRYVEPTLLTGQHHTLKTLREKRLYTSSVYSNESIVSCYDQSNIHTLCTREKTTLVIIHKLDNKSISYAIHLQPQKGIDVTLTDVDANTNKNKAVTTILKHTQHLVGGENLDLWKIAPVLSNIGNELFLAKRDVKKITRSWRMQKASGDNSIYLSVKNLKIVDYGVFITSKSKNVALARVKGSLVSDRTLKVSCVQITYHGSSYWVDGQATLICEEEKLLEK